MLLRIRIRNINIVVVWLFVAASVAYCTPTIHHQGRVIYTAFTFTDEPVYSIVDNFATFDNRLADVGLRLFTPPTSDEHLDNVSNGSVKSLPAVPAAIFMVLSGFLCVTLVKDKRFWLACLAALFWIGQTGLENIPHLTYRLGNNVKSYSVKKLEHTHWLDNFSRIRSKVEGTKYIGLLRYLAGIPNEENSNPTDFPAALIERHHKFISVSACSDTVIVYRTLFSPAFIFTLIPRGPPRLALKHFHTVLI